MNYTNMILLSLTFTGIFLPIILDISTIIFCNHQSLLFFSWIMHLSIHFFVSHSSFSLLLCLWHFDSSVHLLYAVSLPIWEYQKPLLHHQTSLEKCYAFYTRTSNLIRQTLMAFTSRRKWSSGPVISFPFEN